MVKVVPIVHDAVFRAKQFTETLTRFTEGENSHPAPSLKIKWWRILPSFAYLKFLWSFIIIFNQLSWYLMHKSAKHGRK